MTAGRPWTLLTVGNDSGLWQGWVGRQDLSYHTGSGPHRGLRIHLVLTLQMRKVRAREEKYFALGQDHYTETGSGIQVCKDRYTEISSLERQLRTRVHTHNWLGHISDYVQMYTVDSFLPRLLLMAHDTHTHFLHDFFTKNKYTRQLCCSPIMPPSSYTAISTEHAKINLSNVLCVTRKHISGDKQQLW